MKKLLVVLMALAMVISMLAAFPFAASADGEEEASPAVWSGKANIKWYIDALAENPDATEFHLYTAEDLAGLSYLVNGYYDAKTLQTCYNGVWYDAKTGEVLGFQTSGKDQEHCFDYAALGLTLPRPQVEGQTEGYTKNDGVYRPTYSDDPDIEDPIDGSLLVVGDQFKDKTVYLEADVVLNEGSASTWEETAPANVWMPIGGGRHEGSAFSAFCGTFQGKGHTVSGAYFSETDAYLLGLFGKLKEATVRDLIVDNSYFYGDSDLGGLAGMVSDLILYNCHVRNVIVKGNSCLAGLVGAVNGNGGIMLEQCSVTDIYVEGKKSVAAFAGLMNFQPIFAVDCLASGTVKSYVTVTTEIVDEEEVVKSTGGWDVGVITGRSGLSTVTIVNFISAVKLIQEATEDGGSYSATYGLAWGGVGKSGQQIFNNTAALENCYYVHDFSECNGTEIKFPSAVEVEKTDLLGAAIKRYVFGLDFDEVWEVGAKGELPTLRNAGKATTEGEDNPDDPGDPTELDHVTEHEWYEDNWVAEKAATCDKAGTVGHYHCSCGKDFDRDHNELATVTIDPLGHNFGSLIPEKAATADAEGEKAHYECSTCHKLFDENKNPVTKADITIPKVEKKGCFGVIAGVPFVAAVVLGAVVLMRKKEDDK